MIWCIDCTSQLCLCECACTQSSKRLSHFFRIKRPASSLQTCRTPAMPHIPGTTCLLERTRQRSSTRSLKFRCVVGVCLACTSRVLQPITSPHGITCCCGNMQKGSKVKYELDKDTGTAYARYNTTTDAFGNTVRRPVRVRTLPGTTLQRRPSLPPCIVTYVYAHRDVVRGPRTVFLCGVPT